MQTHRNSFAIENIHRRTDEEHHSTLFPGRLLPEPWGKGREPPAPKWPTTSNFKFLMVPEPHEADVEWPTWTSTSSTWSRAGPHQYQHQRQQQEVPESPRTQIFGRPGRRRRNKTDLNSWPHVQWTDPNVREILGIPPEAPEDPDTSDEEEETPPQRAYTTMASTDPLVREILCLSPIPTTEGTDIPAGQFPCLTFNCQLCQPPVREPRVPAVSYNLPAPYSPYPLPQWHNEAQEPPSLYDLYEGGRTSVDVNTISGNGGVYDVRPLGNPFAWPTTPELAQWRTHINRSDYSGRRRQDEGSSRGPVGGLLAASYETTRPEPIPIGHTQTTLTSSVPGPKIDLSHLGISAESARRRYEIYASLTGINKTKREREEEDELAALGTPTRTRRVRQRRS